MIPWSREYGISIGTGHTGGKFDRTFCVKNREKRVFLHESGREKSFLRSGIDTVFYGEFSHDSGFRPNPVKKFILKEFDGQFFSNFFIFFGPIDTK